MKGGVKLLVGLLVLALGVSCQSAGPEPSDSGLPADFAFQYTWQAGSMPPPYHYKYTIRLEPGQPGAIRFQPDYDGAEVPVWTETFEVSEATRLELFELMQEQGVFKPYSGPEEPNGVGGSIASLRGTANGAAFARPSGALGEMEAVYAAIDALVPEATWDSLRAQQETYHSERQ